MTEHEIRELFQRQPVPILRLHLVGGMTFDIRDPDDLVLGTFTVEIALPPDGPLDREAVVNLSQVLWVEVITPMD